MHFPLTPRHTGVHPLNYIIYFYNRIYLVSNVSQIETPVRWLIDIPSPSPMAKRPHTSSGGIVVKVKRHKGVRIRTATAPDSDDERPPSNNSIEYARSVRTRVSTAGKAESVITKAVRIFKAKDIYRDDPGPFIGDHEEVIAEDRVPTKKAKRQRKNKNDSVRGIIFTQTFYTNSFLDQDADLAGRTVDSPRRNDQP